MTIQFQQVHPVAQFFILGVLLYLILCLVACTVSGPMMFPAPKPSYDESYPSVTLRTSEGAAVSGVFFENPDAELTILFSHGNGEDIGRMSEFLNELRGIGFSVFAYDYPGYGLSEGSPSEEGCYQAAEAAYRYLVEKHGMDSRKLILHGRSLGSGPSVELATRYEVGGVILESPFVSAFRVLTRIKLFPFDRFRNLDKIDDIGCPSLIIHGELDEVVPFWHGRALHEAAPEPKEFLAVPEASHNNLSTAGGDAYRKAIRAFGDSLLSRTEGSP